MAVSTFAQTVQFDTLDDAVNVLKRIGAAFAPHEQNPAVMTVRVDAGQLFDPSGPTLTEIAPQNTATITAPTSNPRIDRVVIDESTGAVSVITGTEAANPVPPAITSGKTPICQVRLNTGATSIINDDITDERPSGVGIQSGTGTVTSVASGTGLTGGPITSSGTLNVDVGTTANKIVQLDGSAKLPAVDGSLLTNLPGGFKSVQVFTASGTWTKPAGVNTILAVCTGGGGGGGGCLSTNTTGGGAAGGTAIKFTSSPASSYTVTIGAGGAGGASGGNAGSAGATSSLGALISATGGEGAGAAVHGGTSGGTGTGGDLNIDGGAGANGTGSGSSGLDNGGLGGSSFLGGGGRGGFGSETGGRAGEAYGSGGGGAGGNNSASAGGAGKDGIIWVLEFS
jgi:hypothetical protein